MSLQNPFNSLLQNPRKFASPFFITALWIIISYWATWYLWLPWKSPSLFHPFLEAYPILGVLLVITTVLMGIASALSRPFASFSLVLTLIISLLTIVSAFLILRIPCSGGFACMGHALSLFAEAVVVFLGLVILPIAWSRRVSDSSDFKVLLAKSLMPGLLSLLVFWGLWAISTNLLSSSIP